jgi:hypothetical protein
VPARLPRLRRKQMAAESLRASGLIIKLGELNSRWPAG